MTMRVRELMSTDLYTLSEGETFVSAEQVMRLRHVRHVPVVRDGELVGIVTHRDLIRAQARLFARALGAPQGEDERVVNVTVGEIMTRELVTCAPDTPASDAARQMLERKIGCVLVTDEDALIGILTESDVLAWAVDAMDTMRSDAG